MELGKSTLANHANLYLGTSWKNTHIHIESPGKNKGSTPCPGLLRPGTPWIKNGMAQCLCELKVFCYALIITLFLLREPPGQLLGGGARGGGGDQENGLTKW